MNRGSFTDLWWRSAEGLRLHARDYAEAGGEAHLPVVCLHGLTRNSRDFEAVAPRLAALGRRVICPDVRGRGLSAYDPDPMRYAVATYVGDVLALLEALGLSRAVFIGTSMGGLITLLLSASAPEAVAAAVLNDVGPEIAATGLARIAAYTGQPVKVCDWAEASSYARRINGVAFPDYGEADWEAFARRLFKADAHGRPVLDYDPAIALAMSAPRSSAAVPPDLWPVFGNLVARRPVLAIRGALSDIVDAPLAARMREAAPDAEYVEVPGVGHAPMLNEEAAWYALEAFVGYVD